MAFITFKTFRNIKYAPIAFGIIWFFITLAPTSSLIPLAEVLNDHRMFYPFVGLMLTVVYVLGLYISKNEKSIIENKYRKIILYSSIVVILGAHIYGTRVRTEVWDNGHSLWYDVTIKSPDNGRGLMNYGLKLMADGDYDDAMVYYQKALVLGPRYSYLHTNLAICYNAMGDIDKAEEHFAKALKYGYYGHKTHYYYAIFLKNHKRYDEAINQLNVSLEMAPQFIYSMHTLMQIYIELENWEMLDKTIAMSKQYFPNDVYTLNCTEVC